MVDGLTFSEHHIYFRVVMIDVIVDKGGNNKVANRGVRDGDLVEGDGKWIIQYPSLTWMIPTHPLRG